MNYNNQCVVFIWHLNSTFKIIPNPILTKITQHTEFKSSIAISIEIFASFIAFNNELTVFWMPVESLYILWYRFW